MSGRDFVVIGAGASGTIQALHLLRHGAGSVTLIEREREPGRGTAYGTRRPEHLLNVTARRMIADPDDPGHFERWISDRGGDASTYAQRRQFGDYLRSLIAAVPAGLDIIAGEAIAVTREDGKEQVTLANGRRLGGDAVVLALGNLRPATPTPLRPEDLPGIWVDDPWFGDVAGGLGADATVLLVGTGLTAIDAALTLDARGFRGSIIGLSRRGLVPRGHAVRESPPSTGDDLVPQCVALLRAVRARASTIGWREAVHETRGRAQALWSSASLDERRRFLRHLRPWWDVHRHRIAPAVAERIATMQQEARLQFHAGRIRSARKAGDVALVTWRPRGGPEDLQFEADRIVNCSGPELNVERAREPLLDSLLADGRIRPDACRLGIDVDPECRVIESGGQASASLAAIGPMTRGAFWESIAVTEIAVQALAVARRLTA